jgi:c(7)-type cytochrome triheme protein
MNRPLRRLFLCTALLAAELAPAARAADPLPRLPKAIELPQGKESVGKVTFNHDTHVDAAKPSCLGCHPSTFSILGRSAAAKEKAAPTTPITHERMEKGEACGKCHGKGKAAFEFEDNCNNCHAS